MIKIWLYFTSFPNTKTMDSCNDELRIIISKMINVLKQIVNYEKLGMHAPFKRDFFVMPFIRLANTPILMKRSILIYNQ
jgi:hypothetical protein